MAGASAVDRLRLPDFDARLRGGCSARAVRFEGGE